MLTSGVLWAIAAALLALLYSLVTSSRIRKIPLANSDIQRISGYIEEGAYAFLTREYRTVAYILPIVALMLLFWILVILGIAVLIRWLLTQPLPNRGARDKTPLEIVRERYARGEIDREEYEQKKRDLEP